MTRTLVAGLCLVFLFVVNNVHANPAISNGIKHNTLKLLLKKTSGVGAAVAFGHIASCRTDPRS